MPEWTEPPQAGPQNAVSGFNFGSAPPKKSGRGRKKVVKRMSRASSVASSESSPAPESTNGTNGSLDMVNGNGTDSTRPSSPSSSPQVEERVQQYEQSNKRSLQVALEKTEASEERGPLKRLKDSETPTPTKKKRGRPPKNKTKGDTTPKVKLERSSTPTPKTPTIGSTPHLPVPHIRIKVASPKKPGSPFGFATATKTPPRVAPPPSDDDPTKDNDDFCYACKGLGRFLCCESCPRSFHFSCSDPPYSDDSLPEGQWFCKECRARRFPPEPASPGIFSQLLNRIGRTNPHEFRLPKSIREYFEGVTTGHFGEYSDDHERPEKEITLALDDREVGIIKNYDKAGNPLLCYKCGKNGINGPAITMCDYCPSSWHLDCIEPPLANVKTLGRRWKCPNHADNIFPLKRRPKKIKCIDTDLQRGFVNFGDIEVLLDQGDAEAPVAIQPSLEDIRREKMRGMMIDGVIYRLPESGIKLDFIDAVKMHNWNEARDEAVAAYAMMDMAEKEQVKEVKEVKQVKEKENRLKLADKQKEENKEELADEDVSSIRFTRAEQSILEQARKLISNKGLAAVMAQLQK